MTSRIGAVALAASITLTATYTLAQDKGKAAPEARTGLEIGKKATSFTLKDQEGRERSLDEFLKKGKVALVFYRSADW